jgi:uncharacterized protein
MKDALIRVRAARPEDFDSILAINAQGRPGVVALDEAELKRLLCMDGKLIVADQGGRLLGYVIVFDWQSAYDGEEFRALRQALRAPFLYVDQLAVSIDSRRLGIARRLYESLTKGSVGLPVRPICCEVNLEPPNPVSMEFHRQMGFAVLQRLPVADGRVVALLASGLGQPSS